MNRGEHQLADAIAAMAEAARRGRQDHPSSEALAAHLAGTLTESEAAEVCEHLATCHDCTQKILANEAFADAEESAAAVSRELQLESDLDSLQQRLGRDEPLPSGREVVPLPVGRGRRPLGIPLLAAVAAMVVAAVGLSFWAGTRLTGPVGSTEPRANVHICDLVPIGELVYRGADEELAVPATAPSVLLILNLADLREYPSYQAELVATDRPGSPPRVIGGLQRTRDGNFTLEIGRGMLPAGEYRITLFGIDASSNAREKLAEYQTRLELD